MSYDLMVFEPDHAPRSRGAFMVWYGQQTDRTEPHGYDDPAVPTPALAAWYRDMVKIFPNMNGPGSPTQSDAPEVFDNPRLTDYSVGRSVIYAAFAWSQSLDAYGAVRRFAEKHGVGFFNASAENGEIWLPPNSGAGI